MATITQMVTVRLPDEATLFAADLAVIIEEQQSLAGFEGVAEAALSMVQKSLIADRAARALILPAMSHYKKALEKAQGDGAGTAEFADKLAFLKVMQANLESQIAEKQSLISQVTDTGVPLVTVSEQ